MAFGSLLSAIVLLASKNGSKAAQLENLKAELRKNAEEQARAQKITDNVYSMSDDDARKRLCELQSKQR
ncbi:MAG: hypothetical protein J6S67_25155 [Methanobrevibacter sp.]|nr:hypothetical protein [Methanobrevibacter sp.]